MLALCKDMSEVIELTDEIEKRSLQLCKKGFTAYDALHLASCESVGVAVFLTTDDRVPFFVLEVMLEVPD